MIRPTWDETWMTVAETMAARSTCLRRQVGAVLVKDNRIIASGYNGAPKGLAHCAEAGCVRERLGIPSGERHELCRGVHAEENAVIQAAIHGVSTVGAVVYCTCQPCSMCAKTLIQAGIAVVYYGSGYEDEMARKMLDGAGVRLVKVGQTK